MTWKTIQRDDRAVSIAVTHILTIGITTILISGLLVAGSGLLESEKQSATKTELRTIGNRMASEMTAAFQNAPEQDGSSVTIRVDHPPRVAGNAYTVKLDPSCDGIPGFPSSTPCIRLESAGGQSPVQIPIDPNMEPAIGSVQSVSGGEFYIYIEWDSINDKHVITIQSTDPNPRIVPREVGG